MLAPPPQQPVRPTELKCNHVLHLLLTIFTFGLWIFIWPFVAMYTTSENKARQTVYQQRYEQWVHQYAIWQDAYYQTYGYPAPPAPVR